MPLLTLEQYFGPWCAENPDDTVRANALDLLARVSVLLARVDHIEAAREPRVNSGWRPAKYNATVHGASLRSKHITGQAIDLSDPDGELDEFLVGNQQYLIDAGLWQEHPLSTKNWIHLQCVPTKSGNRVFYP